MVCWSQCRICRHEVGAPWTDAAVTLAAGIGGPAAEVAVPVARPLPLGGLARVVAQLGCDDGVHQHVPLRVQLVPVFRGVNVLVDSAILSSIHTGVMSDLFFFTSASWSGCRCSYIFAKNCL